MKLFFLLAALIFSTFVSAQPINNIVVFGDSLSDNGNLYEYMKRQLPLSPPYYQGRFTNGPVWVELLTKHYFPEGEQKHLLDYAFGGAGVLLDDDEDDVLFSLRREMDTYFLAHQDKADANSLFVVWIGANNYLAVPDDVPKTVHDVTLGIERGLERLVQHGAKHILVINLPDLGQIPAARDYNSVDILTDYSKRHNTVLEQMVTDLQHRYADVRWLYFKVDSMMDDMMKNPQRFGFSNITETCYEELADSTASTRSVLRMVATVKPKANAKDACTGYLFFDPVHPSIVAHKYMAERVIRLLDNTGEKFA